MVSIFMSNTITFNQVAFFEPNLEELKKNFFHRYKKTKCIDHLIEFNVV